uniref:Uncharacterized protein n=1 Tax=Manihot esculenta TaxID=3983 RepID=A0A199UA52_MANES
MPLESLDRSIPLEFVHLKCCKRDPNFLFGINLKKISE